MNYIALTAVSMAIAGATGTFGTNVLANANPYTFINNKAESHTLDVSTALKSENPKVAKADKGDQQDSATPATPPTPAPVMVTVESGDTLSSIAAANNTTYSRIFDANDSISDPNVINPGQQLRIPDPSEVLATRDLPVPAAPASAPVATSTQTTTARRTYTVASYPAVSGNDAKAFIYSRESGNNPNATNPNGCYGLGQDCNGRVRAQCGADYACQDDFFTNYAVARYGSWEGAVAFWQSHHWW